MAVLAIANILFLSLVPALTGQMIRQLERSKEMFIHPGQYFGKYVAIRRINTGGAAYVYLVKHVYLETYAAAKIPKEHESYESRQGLLQEARITASLEHPNIVSILDFGIKDGIPYYVMNYAINGSLRKQYPQGSRLSLNLILEYLEPLADALEYIHHQGLVHQDIKPDNLLLSKNNKVWLSDFGIATMAHEDNQQLPGITGTPAYIAPERLMKHVSPASDQYALGVIAYEWLTGQRPFTGSSHQIVWQHIYAAPPSLRTKFQAISPEVEKVVLKALEKDPKRRFPDVKTFIMALSRAKNISSPPFQVR